MMKILFRILSWISIGWLIFVGMILLLVGILDLTNWIICFVIACPAIIWLTFANHINKKRKPKNKKSKIKQIVEPNEITNPGQLIASNQLKQIKKQKEITCPICGKAIPTEKKAIKLYDGYICNDCWVNAGFTSTLGYFTREFKDAVRAINDNECYTIESVKQRIKNIKENEEIAKNFKPTKGYGKIMFNDEKKQLLIQSREYNKLFNYNQIVSYELIEDNKSIIKGGVGAPIVGGLLMGGVGAIVGSNIGKKTVENVCKQMYINITFRNSEWSNERVYVNTFNYNIARKNASDIISALQLAVDLVEQTSSNVEMNVNDLSTMLYKYKELLDQGLISEEEFVQKKKQLLGL